MKMEASTSFLLQSIIHVLKLFIDVIRKTVICWNASKKQSDLLCSVIFVTK